MLFPHWVRKRKRGNRQNWPPREGEGISRRNANYAGTESPEGVLEDRIENESKKTDATHMSNNPC